MIRGACWATVHGFAKSPRGMKRLSSSSNVLESMSISICLFAVAKNYLIFYKDFG